MICGGVSLQGKAHARREVPDQDAYWVGPVFDDGWLLCVSDGVGSCAHAEVGSQALCRAAWQAALICGCVVENPEAFLRDLHEIWLAEVRVCGLAVKDCCAAALVGVLGADGIWGFRLGDGFLAIAAGADSIVLFDDKADGALDETVSLSEEVPLEAWTSVHLGPSQSRAFAGMIAATDGVQFEQERETLLRLVREFSEGNAGLPQANIEASMREWMPQYGGYDDTTLAFLLPDALPFVTDGTKEEENGDV